MTKKELHGAREIADREDLSGIDDTVLHGLYLPHFQHPVTTTLRVVARTMKDFKQFDGDWDAAALDEFCNVARNRIRIV